MPLTRAECGAVIICWFVTEFQPNWLTLLTHEPVKCGRPLSAIASVTLDSFWALRSPLVRILPARLVRSRPAVVTVCPVRFPFQGIPSAAGTFLPMYSARPAAQSSPALLRPRPLPRFTIPPWRAWAFSILCFFLQTYGWLRMRIFIGYLMSDSRAPALIFRICPSLLPNSSVGSRTHRGRTWSCSSGGFSNPRCFVRVTTYIHTLSINLHVNKEYCNKVTKTRQGKVG